MKRITALLLAILMLVACLSGCGASQTSSGGEPPKADEPTKKEPLVIAVQSMYASYPMGLILAENMAEEYGLELEIEVFSSGATTTKQWANGISQLPAALSFMLWQTTTAS